MFELFVCTYSVISVLENYSIVYCKGLTYTVLVPLSCRNELCHKTSHGELCMYVNLYHKYRVRLGYALHNESKVRAIFHIFICPTIK